MVGSICILKAPRRVNKAIIIKSQLPTKQHYSYSRNILTKSFGSREPGVNSDDGVKSDVDEEENIEDVALLLLLLVAVATGAEKKLSTALRCIERKVAESTELCKCT